jgi:GH15 family glucan-1,4-alpha-glucosidase
VVCAESSWGSCARAAHRAAGRVYQLTAASAPWNGRGIDDAMATAIKLRRPERIDGYAPLRDYAVIGTKRTAALVALDGAIDWLALPRFDGPSIFGALLDQTTGGRFTLQPRDPFEAERRYLEDTNVLETTFTTAGGAVRVTDAMSLPITRSLDFNEIVRRVDGVSGEVELVWCVEPRFAYGAHGGEIVARGDVPVFCHGGLSIALQVHGLGAPACAGGIARGGCVLRKGDVGVLALSCFEGGPLAFAGRDQLLARLDDTVEHWRRWSQVCSYDGPWASAVRRSALALELLVDDTHGAIVAAPTMGLPEAIGGQRNYDYRYAWLRDGNLTLEAMLRLGFHEQVHVSLDWMLRAIRPTHPRLRPIYRLDGRPRLPDEKLDLEGYRRSAPVTLGNGAQAQLQLGNYGDVFDTVWNYVREGNALDRECAQRLSELADYVCLIWNHPDAGLWELPQMQDYTQSKLACWLALHRAQELIDAGALPAGHENWAAEQDAIREYVERRCWSQERGAYARAAGSNELDAAVLLPARGTFLTEEPERLGATVDAIRAELGAGGPLLYRYSGMQDEEGAFLACSFWMVEALARIGRLDEATAAMDELVALGNDVGLYSEEIDPGSLEFRGNLPQALTHLALVNAADVCRQVGAG